MENRTQKSALEPSLAALPRTPAAHFRLRFYAALLKLVLAASEEAGGLDKLLEQAPFLALYLHELASHGLAQRSLDEAPGWLAHQLELWEADARALPLRSLEHSLRDEQALELWLQIGLVEEDPRLAALYGVLAGRTDHARPSVATLGALLERDAAPLRGKVSLLLERKLISVSNPEAPRPDWIPSVTSAAWDLARGSELGNLLWPVEYCALAGLPRLEQLIVPAELRELLQRVVAAGEPRPSLLIRGPRSNGRKTLALALAQAFGRGALLAPFGTPGVDSALLGSFAGLLGAMPILLLDPAHSECVELPRLPGYDGPLVVVLPSHGGARGPALENSLTLELGLPDRTARQRLWRAALPEATDELIDAASVRFLLSSGNVFQVAKRSRAQARFAEKPELGLPQLRAASRAVNREALDGLAEHLPARVHRDALVVSQTTRLDLDALEARCRFREGLTAQLGPALASAVGRGVRALLKGPSGTGKTLAARILAERLELDLYRVDLSATVSKYIGETEKNLERVLSAAEELGVMLLLDEGDALLGQRTGVQSANDRYANLETNFLLQRLESFEGVVLVTTNAAQQLDSAFQRRMDFSIEFASPGVEERLAIWRLHLPENAERDGAVPSGLLDDIAYRCLLSGGQIKNAVLYAALLSLPNHRPISGEHLIQAVEREYQMLGQICPLSAAQRASA